jgi:tetratricopeptide (TPR) repeat protein
MMAPDSLFWHPGERTVDPSSKPPKSIRTEPVLGALHALDQGRFSDAVALYAEGMTPVDGIEGSLWRAEVAIYLGRFEEAEDALGADRPLVGSDTAWGPEHLAVRRNLLRAELAMEDGSYEQAHAAFMQLKEDAHACEDAFTEMRAWYDLARVAYRRSEHTNCLEYAAVAASLAGEMGNSFYQGCCIFNRAAALFEAGDIDASERAYAEALSLLSSSENLRFRALAELGYAGVLVARDRIEEGLLLLQRAEATVTRLGNVKNIQIIRNATAWAYFALGDYDAAQERAHALLAMDQGSTDARAEFFGLKLLACVELARDRVFEATKAAGEAVRLASLTANPINIREARMLEARCMSRSGNLRAVDWLREAVAEADSRGAKYQSTLARIYLADALHTSDPVAASAALEEAKERAREAPSPWVQAELRAFERVRASRPVRLEDGHLVVDVQAGWPTMRSARESVERYLYERALEQTRGNAAAAGRLLGLSRYEMLTLGRILRGEAPRPSRGKHSDGADANSKRRRPRTRS